jgi:hypothetical protein
MHGCFNYMKLVGDEESGKGRIQAGTFADAPFC